MYHPVIIDVEGFEINAEEKALFNEFRPFGFILFKRNCDTPEQLKALTDQMRDITGNADVPILIDQEGGRVARLGPPHWRKYPSAEIYSHIYETSPDLAITAVQVHASLMAAELTNVGINIDCYPVADLLFEGADKVIGDRSYGDRPNKVSFLARAASEGMISNGVIPIIKHIPGHGRADVDSHLKLPVVETPLDILRETDFIPFTNLNDMPCAMTAHVIYSAIDADKCATISPKVINDIIRGEMGFEGVLVSDDISMKALRGTPAENALEALEAGCDLALHCNGTFEERRAVLAATKDQLLGEDNRIINILKKKRAPRDINQEMLYDWLLEVIKGYSS
ncbi:MAG: beta-N-acetylhexosaminidase [Kordiimonadaceae bacterium]|jgi:beta-N-acetylhexosaminidase|nr:beta-N-acetylhexosaminidase [Kordiimonadaceae bacterium]MBT6036246.1 beta-N-acetylhexosaminidase [Kordiimonadaceae bacterium]MBT6329729.1 beta-N-acetylhexosaminidase [Kordiimonadaceae bacterium]MBT7582296.1 beta-N-acetylhexosaminidase [Kordiimonadaceae bacterium]